MRESQRANAEWGKKQRPNFQSSCKPGARVCSDEEIKSVKYGGNKQLRKFVGREKSMR